MKKIFVVIAVFFLSFSVSAQKLIATINTDNRVEPYSFKYNKTDGAFVYADYDTTKKKNVLFTSKGKSGEYDFAMIYSALFDNAGNSYSYAYNNIADTVYKYYLIKNSEEVASFDYVSDGWDIYNGVIYFYAKENNRAFIASYDTRSGILSRGKEYNEIFLINFRDDYYEGEPVGTIGFTSDGRPFYLASENNMKFIVIGTTEQKHYSDVDAYMVKKDNSGGLAYIAKSKGTFYTEKGNTFLVQGNKEYKSFDFVYGPAVFDKLNNPVYVASDSIGEYLYRSRLVVGNKEGQPYNGNIYEYKITPGGKISYVVSTQEPTQKKGEYKYESFLVLDEDESRRYSSISSLSFIEGDIPVFTASDKSGKYFVVKGDRKISEKYDNVYDYIFLSDGSLAYLSSNFGNYEKQIPDQNYVHILGKKYGPYEYVSMADYTTGKYILSFEDKFAFVTGKLTSREDYSYKYKVITGEWESSEYEMIDQVKIINGKIFFVAGDMFDKTKYLYNYNLYIDNMLVADNYSSITDLTYDKIAGKVSCIGCKLNSFYLLEFGF